MDQTALNLRYKTFSNLNSENNFNLINNYGLALDKSFKNTTFNESNDSLSSYLNVISSSKSGILFFFNKSHTFSLITYFNKNNLSSNFNLFLCNFLDTSASKYQSRDIFNVILYWILFGIIKPIIWLNKIYNRALNILTSFTSWIKEEIMFYVSLLSFILKRWPADIHRFHIRSLIQYQNFLDEAHWYAFYYETIFSFSWEIKELLTYLYFTYAPNRPFSFNYKFFLLNIKKDDVYYYLTLIYTNCLYLYELQNRLFPERFVGNQWVFIIEYDSLLYCYENIDVYPLIDLIRNFVNYYINFFSISSFKSCNLVNMFDTARFSVFSLSSKSNLLYSSDSFNALKTTDDFLFSNEERSNNSRYLRFENPVFKYDYKSGDYFIKIYNNLSSFLIPSIVNLTSGLKTSSWFYSVLTNELNDSFLLNNLNALNSSIKNNTKNGNFTLKFNRIVNSDIFFYFVHFLNKSNENNNLNFKWVSTNSLELKFNRMFLTSSMQQRLYSNWRQLKFTREAWRWKMLLARHQKTLFRRYVNEDGVFWSIERNAKDLIPGWAMITPFSSRTRYTAVGKTDIGLMGVLLVLNSSIISGANFLVTYRYLSTLNNRNMRDARAFFTESILVASWMMIFANPMLVIGIVMLLSDRHWQTSFFDYSGGGDTVLFQHMFWFFGHPEVYVIIIPTFGFTNTMLSFYLKKRVSARASLLYSLYTIAFLGFFVWGHHMYMVGLSHTTRMLFSTLTVMISVPAATKIMHWCVTTANSSFSMELPLLFTFTFIFFFVSGGISGMCVAHTGMDILFHDTFYVIGHFHVMLAGGAMFASFGAFYFYFPAIFGVKYSRIYAYLHYTYYLIGQLMTVIPMFWLGYAGMPRRVLDYPFAFGGWHSIISAGHMLNVAGLMAFFIMIFDSLRQARAATRNTFGISRYNIRLNFYLYEIYKLIYIQQKALFLDKKLQLTKLKLNKLKYVNFEPLESTLFTYTFIKTDKNS